VKAIVVAGGNAAPEDAALLSGADLVIAADSGAHWLDRSGVPPDLVIGDMDSLDPDLLDRLAARGTEVERHPADKEASDLELAMSRAAAAGADEVVILGALRGERLDHELANLLLLAHPRLDGLDVALLDGGTTIRRIGTDAGPGSVELTGAPGDLVTLLALAGAVEGVTTRGLRYPLRSETLPPGPARGLSNEMLDTTAGVTATRGRLLVIHTRAIPTEDTP
jgi:thiamine pyrophosphokinase